MPVERVDFTMYTHQYRNRGTYLGVSIGAAGTTALTVGDATFLMNHDLLDLTDPSTGNVERVQVNGDPTSATTINVTRGVSTTVSGTYTQPASGSYLTGLSSIGTGSAGNLNISLVGSSRTGSEVGQTGLTTIGVARTQYCQTFQAPVQVGGSAQTARAQVLPGGVQTPFDFNMTVQLQNMVDDIENTLYYGQAQAPNDTAGITAKMNGLKYILQTNNVTSPTNSSAYGSTDLIRDTLQAARSGGGEPDLLVVSTNFMSGFATWGQAVQRVPAGETAFGTPINVLEAPFLHGVTIIEAPLLQPFTAIALTSSEVYIRNKRNPYWQLRGSRGDMVEGDWLAELAIEVVNEPHHAWVQGISAFSAN